MRKQHHSGGRLTSAVNNFLKYPALVLFMLVLFGLFFIDLATPDKQRSELENTTLQQRPALSLAGKNFSGMVDAVNRYFTDYGDYVKDQVAGRDGWVQLQAGFETLLFQKTQSGGMLLGEGDRMFARTFGLLTEEQKRLPLNTQAVRALATRWPGKVTVLLAPSASTIHADAVPENAPLIDENAYLDNAFAAFAAAGAAVVDVRPTLAAHADEYLYYRTDHHWTTLGAWYAHAAYCESLGLAPFDRALYTPVEVPDFYGTSYAKARTANAVPDVITYYPMSNPMQLYAVNPMDGSITPTGQPLTLYNEAQWNKYDKYAAFLHGNNGFARIEGDGKGKVLVIKDSYANSFIPYLTDNYAQIDVVDFRSFASSPDPVIRENDYDNILVLYSFASFKADQYLYRAGLER